MSTRNKVIIFAIVAVAAVLRLLAIFHVGDFTWDEMFSFTYSQKPWLDSFKFWTWETNPPLHMFFLKLWFYVFPANEFTERLPSMIFGLLTVWWVYKTGRDYFNERAGQIAALIIALHPYHIFISIFGRAYSLLLCLSTISIYYCLKIFVKKQFSKKDLIILAAINLLISYTHLTGFLILIGETAVVLLLNAKRIKQWILMHLIPAALWLIWAVPAFASKMADKDSLGSAWFFNFHHNLLGIFTPLKLIFFGPGNGIYILFLIFIFLAYLVKYFIKQTKTDSHGIYFISILLIFSIPIISSLVMNLWNIRFLIVALPAFTIIVAYLFTTNIKNQLLTAIVAIIISLCGIFNLFSMFPLNNWARLNNYLTENYRPELKQLFIGNDFIEKLLADRYYKAPIEKNFFLPAGADIDWDKSLITGNYLRYLRGKDELDGWYSKNNLDRYNEIFLLYSKDVGVELQSTFTDHGWTLAATDSISPAKDERVILRYEKHQ